MLHDLDSSNGTFLNGQRIKRALLRAGDIIMVYLMVLAHFALTYFAVAAAEVLPMGFRKPGSWAFPGLTARPAAKPSRPCTLARQYSAPPCPCAPRSSRS